MGESGCGVVHALIVVLTYVLLSYVFVCSVPNLLCCVSLSVSLSVASRKSSKRMQLVQINETNTRANSATTGQDANVVASEDQTPQSPPLQPVVEEKSGKYCQCINITHQMHF